MMMSMQGFQFGVSFQSFSFLDMYYNPKSRCDRLTARQTKENDIIV
jgi:hypothetical protein